MLIWIYIISMVLFYGAAFSHSWSNTYGSRSPEKLSAAAAAQEKQGTTSSQSKTDSVDTDKADANLSGLVPERRISDSPGEPA